MTIENDDPWTLDPPVGCDSKRDRILPPLDSDGPQRNNSVKALVIGASGHVGNAITRALLDRKWQVTACGRRAAPPLNISGLPVTCLPGDADTPGQFDKWIAGHDLVLERAAPYSMSLVSPVRGPRRAPAMV